MGNDYLKLCINYCELGYDISLTSVYGKEAIKMVKRYSHPAGDRLESIQIINHERLLDDKYYSSNVIRFLYEQIEEREDNY